MEQRIKIKDQNGNKGHAYIQTLTPIRVNGKQIFIGGGGAVGEFDEFDLGGNPPRILHIPRKDFISPTTYIGYPAYATTTSTP